MEDLLLFLVLLLISGAVWFIDRLGRAAARAEQERQGPPPLPPSARVPRRRPGAEAPLGAAIEILAPMPEEQPPPLPPRDRVPPRVRPPSTPPVSAGSTSRARVLPVPRVPAPSAPQRRPDLLRSRSMQLRVQLREVPRPIDQMRRQRSRAHRVDVARARDGMVLAVILGRCRADEPYEDGLTP